MHKIFAALALTALAALLVINNYGLQEEARAASIVPDTEVSAPTPVRASLPVAPDKEPAAQSKAPAPKKITSTPVQLTIPAIALASRVVPMGVNNAGELDVPSGNTNDVGWYAKGVAPGNIGSAVMDAHVYAAFSKLDEVALGDDIYVDMQDGERLHFVVKRSQVYKLAELSPDELFNADNGRYLHLITCAGELKDDSSTYTHRLVVFAELVQ